MNIVYCFDNNKYRDMAEKSAQSVIKYNPNANIHYLTEDKNNELEEFTTDLCGYNHVSKACFLRLLIPKYFKQFERCLYLDCDTVCKGDISGLYEAEFGDNYIIGCEGIDYSKKQANELSISFYINSGVLLFNNTLMNKDNYFQQIKDKWRGALGKPKVFSADETIINYVFHNKIKRISEKYNYCYNRKYTGREVDPKDVKIWHITGSDKENFNKCLNMRTL